VEDRLKKMVESSLKEEGSRALISIVGKSASEVTVNKQLFLRYLKTTRAAEETMRHRRGSEHRHLINLPGVIFFPSARFATAYGGFKKPWNRSGDLVAMRSREGQALSVT